MLEFLDLLTWGVVALSAVGWVSIIRRHQQKKRDEHQG